MLQSYFFEGHQTVCQATLAFEHCGVRPFSKLIQLCVGLDLAKPNLRLKNPNQRIINNFNNLFSEGENQLTYHPRRRNVAAQVAEELKTVTYATPPMEERRKKRKTHLPTKIQIQSLGCLISHKSQSAKEQASRSVS